ncbi:serine protease [Gammaproteobacteria bacterium]
MAKNFFMAFTMIVILGVNFDTRASQEGRVIVKYKADASILTQPSTDRAAHLSRRLGLAMRFGRRLATRMEVVRSAEISSQELSRRLAAQSDVEYAVPDRLRAIRTLPNDTLFAEQWYLQSTEAAAIRADRAWNVTTGSAEVVVAILDTGVRYEHPDLAGKLLNGYDFISDPSNAGDGDSRDDDASDAGDYISSADARNADLRSLCGELVEQNSSWHGTRVAGIVGAASNNSIGIAGTSWGVTLLPVRVMGKCGGFDSDIIAAMRWAAGLTVPEIPDNPHPARVINLSLGGDSPCDAAYTDAVGELMDRSVLVVTAVSNESGAVGAPANCPGVMAVAGVRHNGIKVGYSGFGPEISIGAPAGNCVNDDGSCLYSINTTSDMGTTTPVKSTYTEPNDMNVGTSFAAPQVSGVAALMLSVNPELTPVEIIDRIKNSARPFPADPTLTDCPSEPMVIDQCNCTTSSCGAGLLDAEAAVIAAMTPIPTIAVLDPLSENSTIRLDGKVDAIRPGQTITAWNWALISSPGGASLIPVDAPSTSLRTTAAGTYVISLTVTNNLGVSGTTQENFKLTASGSSSKEGGGGAVDGYALLGLILISLLGWWKTRR